jgi:hypothetical protein
MKYLVNARGLGPCREPPTAPGRRSRGRCARARHEVHTHTDRCPRVDLIQMALGHLTRYDRHCASPATHTHSTELPTLWTLPRRLPCVWSAGLRGLRAGTCGLLRAAGCASCIRPAVDTQVGRWAGRRAGSWPLLATAAAHPAAGWQARGGRRAARRAAEGCRRRAASSSWPTGRRV